MRQWVHPVKRLDEPEEYLRDAGTFSLLTSCINSPGASRRKLEETTVLNRKVIHSLQEPLQREVELLSSRQLGTRECRRQHVAVLPEMMVHHGQPESMILKRLRRSHS